jgi:TPR repeat protein
MPRRVAYALASATVLLGALVPAAAAPQARFGSPPVVLVRAGYDAATRALFTQAARGNPRAQAQLGFMYEYGRGVPQNYVTAVKWYQAAAEQGDADGQYFLGMMFEKGHGVPQSDTLAYMWINLATSHAAPRVRDYFAHIRDAIANKLTPAQMGDAQWLALNFTPKNAP